jgi:hypothetical protein
MKLPLDSFCIWQRVLPLSRLDRGSHGRTLSDTAGAFDRRLSCRRPYRHPRAFAGSMAVGTARAAIHRRRSLHLTWAGLPPAGSHQLCLAHLLDNLVCAQLEFAGDREPECRRGFQIPEEILPALPRQRAMSLPASGWSCSGIWWEPFRAWRCSDRAGSHRKRQVLPPQRIQLRIVT